MTTPLDTHRAIVAALPGWPTILREPAPIDALAPLLGPRVGLRARAPMYAEPRWTLTNLAVEAHRGAKEVRNLGCMLRALAFWSLVRDAEIRDWRRRSALMGYSTQERLRAAERA